MKKSLIKPNKNQLIYLASLYASGTKSQKTLHKRYKRVLYALTELLKSGYFVFSPIVHNHPVNLNLRKSPGWDFWGPYDKNMLKRCNHMIILADNRWEISNGINEEIKCARKLNIPIHLLYLNKGNFNFKIFHGQGK